MATASCYCCYYHTTTTYFKNTHAHTHTQYITIQLHSHRSTPNVSTHRGMMNSGCCGDLTRISNVTRTVGSYVLLHGSSRWILKGDLIRTETIRDHGTCLSLRHSTIQSELILRKHVTPITTSGVPVLELPFTARTQRHLVSRKDLAHASARRRSSSVIETYTSRGVGSCVTLTSHKTHGHRVGSPLVCQSARVCTLRSRRGELGRVGGDVVLPLTRTRSTVLELP